MENPLQCQSRRRRDGSRRKGLCKHVFSSVLKSVAPPAGQDSRPEMPTAADWFLGYLLLDALIGNTDRHHENWAVIESEGKQMLAPSYDHASCLGRELGDPERADRLRGGDRQRTVARYCERTRPALYEAPGDRRPLRGSDKTPIGFRRQFSSIELLSLLEGL